MYARVLLEVGPFPVGERKALVPYVGPCPVGGRMS